MTFNNRDCEYILGGCNLKKIFRQYNGFVCLLAAAILLTGCCVSHVYLPATCEAPKTCRECGKTEGEALSHVWSEATCSKPSTCELCGKTKGDTLEHKFSEATCEEAQTCSDCGLEAGNALGHTVDAGKCERCGEIQNKDTLLRVYADAVAVRDAMSLLTKETYAGLSGTGPAGVYAAMKKWEPHRDAVYERLKELYDACGDIETLRPIKNSAKAVMDEKPADAENKNKNHLSIRLDQYEKYGGGTIALLKQIDDQKDLFLLVTTDEGHIFSSDGESKY